MPQIESASIHVWHRCHGCGAAPIAGPRFDCQSCPAGPDNHLCEACLAAFRRGALAHPPPDGLAAGLAIARHVFTVAEGCPAAALDAWLRVDEPRASVPPRVPDGCVVRPEFYHRRSSFVGSYGCVVARAGGPPLILTALHVMDELIKAAGVDASSSDACTGGDLPRCVDRVVLYDPFATPWVLAEIGAAGAMLVLPGARLGEEEPYCQNDLAAFVAAPGGALTPIPLAEEAPDVGEPIWLAAGSHGQRAIEAVVVERTARSLVFRFGGGTPGSRYTSGAPLLNAAGAVAGINVGAGCVDGRRLGHAVHAANIRLHLRDALSPRA